MSVVEARRRGIAGVGGFRFPACGADRCGRGRRALRAARGRARVRGACAARSPDGRTARSIGCALYAPRACALARAAGLGARDVGQELRHPGLRGVRGMRGVGAAHPANADRGGDRAAARPCSAPDRGTVRLASAAFLLARAARSATHRPREALPDRARVPVVVARCAGTHAGTAAPARRGLHARLRASAARAGSHPRRVPAACPARPALRHAHRRAPHADAVRGTDLRADGRRTRVRRRAPPFRTTARGNRRRAARARRGLLLVVERVRPPPIPAAMRDSSNCGLART